MLNPKKQMKCFVAMAFDREETDAVYDNLIVPQLERVSVKPIRVDRVEHNDEIDNKIITELKECEFAIADLTYARPSVYFEAGFAQRTAPVIYTCRRDHSRPRPDDEYGNFRVHFDLLMKNIIWWSHPKDRTFKKRLHKRVSHVLAPLLRKRKDLQVEAEDILRFKSLSLSQQKTVIKEAIGSVLREAAFKIGKPEVVRADWVGLISRKGQFQLVAAKVLEKTSRKDLTLITLYISHLVLSESNELRSAFAKQRVSSVTEDVFICSTEQIPHSRASTALPDFSFNHGQDCFEGEVTAMFGDWRNRILGRANVRIHIIDGINSESAFRRKIQTRVGSIKRQFHLESGPQGEKKFDATRS